MPPETEVLAQFAIRDYLYDRVLKAEDAVIRNVEAPRVASSAYRPAIAGGRRPLNRAHGVFP